MSANLQTILSPISADMQLLNEVIRSRLGSEVALINQISAYIRWYLFYFQFFTSSNLVLFATGFYDRVHIEIFL